MGVQIKVNTLSNSLIIDDGTIYTFEIEGISRALLQELARHNANLTVRSTRYTLKQLKSTTITLDNVLDYCVIPPRLGKIVAKNWLEDTLASLHRLQVYLEAGISNDVCKYQLPESFKTSLVWTINIRSLQNFLKLRTDKAALPEIQVLALAIYDALPESHKYMLEDFVDEEARNRTSTYYCKLDFLK